MTLRFIARRALWTIPVLILIAVVTFVLMHLAPGGPWDKDPGKRNVDAITLKNLERLYGLDKPAWRQFTAYMIGDFDHEGEWKFGAIGGNLGPSYRQRGMTVQDILFKAPAGKPFTESRFGYSVRLGVLALFLAMIVGIPSGVIAALKQNTWIDYLVTLITNIGVSVPNFVMGIFLVILFAVQLKLVPVAPRTWTDPRVWVIPSFVLAFGTMAYTARLMRSSMLEVMRQDYVRTARAKGLSETRVVTIHMLKNALIPVVTILGPALAGLLVGSFVIESMFAFPGIGREFVQSISNRDYSMIMGTTLIYAVLIVAANLSVDVVYGLLDPRIKIK
ncbi:MAG: ABC transporter permease [Chloroflexi bacterium]|nr:ABC transporter permease [Chloroflexota bacterium]